MRPITEITDLCLSGMKPHKLWSWEEWWAEIVDDIAPKKNTWAYHKWIAKRNQVKNQVNKELGKFLLAERLICVGEGKGLFLVDKVDVAGITIEQKVSRFMGHVEGANKVLQELATAKVLSDADKKMCLRVCGVFELQGNALLGTVVKMKSLPKPLRKSIIQQYSFDGNGEKREVVQ